MKRDKTEDTLSMAINAGRNLDEQIECIRKYGNHAVTPVLRSFLLKSLGISKPKLPAENMLIFGCYIPFMFPQMISDYFKLLSQLGIEYTFLEEEYCCGFPMISSTREKEREEALKASREFMQINLDLARQRGAKNLAYLCIGCIQTAKTFFPDDLNHVYYFELILDRLENMKLSIAPTMMGYYEGCHQRRHSGLPKFNLDWERCRRFLDNIDGLTLVDLPNQMCCIEHADSIVSEAKNKDLDAILCICNGCYNRIKTAGEEKVEVKYLTELLLESLV